MEEVKKLVVEVGKDSVESLGLPVDETKKMTDQVEENINSDFEYFINDNSSKSNTNNFICSKSEKSLIELVGNSINDNSLKINMEGNMGYDLFFEDTKREYFIILKSRLGYATSSNYKFMQNELIRFQNNSGLNNINNKNTVVVILLFTEKRCNVTVSINRVKIKRIYALNVFMNINIKSEIVQLADKIENSGMPLI